MKAVIVRGPGDIGLFSVRKPVAGPGEMIIKVSCCGICGTDLAILEGNMSFVKDGLIRYPIRIGHEWSGTIEEIGEGVAGFSKGDNVVADNAVSCGKCNSCKEGYYSKCENLRSVGTVNCWDGCFAEYMLMPARHVYKLPDNISMEEGALIEPATIALCGLKNINLNTCNNLLVVGTGPIGLAAVALAKNMGIKKVLLSGRKKFKLDMGIRMGADAVINVTKEDLIGFVMKNTGNKGVDAVIETSGNIETINSTIGVIKNKGILALIGFYETTLDQFPVDRLVLNQLQLRGVAGEFGLVAEVIERMSVNGLDLKPLITHRFSFADVVEAIKTAMDKNDTKIKMLVNMEE
jgi:Threonine dehydrogenase and related Zn-dependent dehydrogenases